MFTFHNNRFHIARLGCGWVIAKTAYVKHANSTMMSDDILYREFFWTYVTMNINNMQIK